MRDTINHSTVGNGSRFTIVQNDSKALESFFQRELRIFISTLGSSNTRQMLRPQSLISVT